jgi:hypothetical protein
MRSPGKLIGSIVCLGVLIATPAALAQAIPKALIRLCLRNVATGIACYVIGRGGELIIDGSLSSAWAKAKETVSGEAPEDDGKYTTERSPNATPPSFKSPILEPIPPSELGALSKRLPGSQAKNVLTEGFFIYEAPKPLDPDKSLLPQSHDLQTGLPKSGPSELAPPKSLLPEPGLPKLATPPYGDPYLSPEAYRARNAHKLVPPATSLTAGQFGKLEDECRRKRERETGLSLVAVLVAPDFDAKFKRRMDEVVAPCMNPRPF